MHQKKFCWLTADRFVGEHSWLLVAVNVVLFCCCFVLASCLGHLKGTCMTKLMKVCIGNNQRIDSWKCTSTETLDKNKKTLILTFRCWHYKTNRQSLWKLFEDMNEMFIFNSFCIEMKYLRCCFVFFVLKIVVFTCSTISFRSLKALSKF